MANEIIDLANENLHCHHLLFIKEVLNSKYNTENQYFKLLNLNLCFRKARLNGIVVSQKTIGSDDHFWLDDGTGVIRAIISNNILQRRDGYSIQVSTNLTVFGEVKQQNNEVLIVCGGFKIEEDCIAEIYHWLKILQDRPNHARYQPKNMFYSLSSFPSPNRLLNSNFLTSPVQDIDPNNAAYLWSPNHKYATSTPITVHQQNIIHQSPLRNTKHDYSNSDNDDFDDDFDNIDFSLIESNALNQINKRKRSLSDS